MRCAANLRLAIDALAAIKHETQFVREPQPAE